MKRLPGHENASTTTAFYAVATLHMISEAINAANPAIDTRQPCRSPTTVYEPSTVSDSTEC